MFPKVMEWLYIYQACLKKLKRMKRKVILTYLYIGSQIGRFYKLFFLTVSIQCSNNILGFKWGNSI